jgi:hypothetical protein
VFALTIWSYLLLCVYVGATWFVANRWPGGERYRVTSRVVPGMLVLGTLWMAWALVVPRHHANASGDYMYESVGCLLACLTGLYGLAWSIRSVSLAGGMSMVGGGWLLMMYATLIARQ